MREPLQINTAELRRAFEVVLSHIESKTGPSILLDVDHFWSVSGNDLFDVYRSPELTIGQIVESWDNLARERSGDSESALAYDFVWLAEVLKAIGHTTGEDPSR